MVRLADGELLLGMTMQNTRTAKDFVDEQHFITRSRDAGRTWSAPELSHIVPEDHPGYPPHLHVMPDGRLISWIHFSPKEGGELHVAESTDAGHTWSKPVPMGLPSKPAMMDFGVCDRAMNVSDGSMLMAFFGPCSYPGAYPKDAVGQAAVCWGALHMQAFTCRSADGGRSWERPTPLDDCGSVGGKPIVPNVDMTEFCAVELDPGCILALIRPLYSPWMWETWSHDGGRSWGPAMRGPFAGYASSNMVRTANGAILVAHRLPSLAVHCSRDGAVTWDQGTLIDSGSWAMGSMIEVEPNLVLYIYWDTPGTLMRGQFLKVTDSAVESVRFW
jgi:hypothetical protein